MLAAPRSESTRLAAALCAMTLALIPAVARAGSAQDRHPFGAPALPTTKNPCASYGAGFESVGGSTCVKIGGRVHVEAATGASGWRVAPSAGAALRAGVPDMGGLAQPGAPSHLRLPKRY